jgi:hypothetical protein
MRTYEVIVKTPAIYGREGAGTVNAYKVDAGSRKGAAAKAIGAFSNQYKPKDMVGRTMFLTIVRVN